MERYSRLGQFFISPDKTLDEIFSSSPYTTNSSLTDSSGLADTTSLTSNDEEVSKVFQPIQGDEKPPNQKYVLDDPPSKLHLKRRPKTNAEKKRNEESQKLASEDHQNYLNVSQWSTKPWKEATSAGVSPEHTRHSTQKTNSPARPRSCQNTNRKSEDAPYRNPEIRHRSNSSPARQKIRDRSVEEKIIPNRYHQNRENNNIGKTGRSSIERDRHDQASSDRGSNSNGRNDRTSSNRGNNDRSRRDRRSNDRSKENATTREEREKNHGTNNRDLFGWWGATGSRDRRTSNRSSHESSDRDSHERHRQDPRDRSDTSTDRVSSDSTRKRTHSYERSPESNATSFKKILDSLNRPASASGERSKSDVVDKSPQKRIPDTKEVLRTEPRTHKTLEIFRNTFAIPPDNRSEQKKTEGQERSKEVSYEPIDQGEHLILFQNCSDKIQKIRNEILGRKNPNHPTKCDTSPGPSEQRNRNTMHSRHQSALSETHQQLGETRHQTEMKPTEVKTGAEHPRDKRHRTSSSTLPNNSTPSPKPLRTELQRENDSASIDKYQEGFSGRNLEKAKQERQRENSKNCSKNTSAEISERSQPESQAGTTNAQQSIFSVWSTNASFACSRIESLAQSPTRPLYETQQWFTSQSYQEPKLFAQSVLPPSPPCQRDVSFNQKAIANEQTPPKTSSKIKDKLDQSNNCLEDNGSESTSFHEQIPVEIPAMEMKFPPRKSEEPNCTFDQENLRVHHWLDSSWNIKTTKEADDNIQSNPISKKPLYQPYSHETIHESQRSRVTKTEDIFGLHGIDAIATLECSEINKTRCTNSTSWRTSSGSDITDGESIFDIEKFKQTVRSAEVPQELLEPLEESEESENLLNILETISESPLEDCSQIQISSNYGDEYGSTEEGTHSSQVSGNTPQRPVSRGNTFGVPTNNSASDSSDIQLHYAYGRKRNDKLELQWVKLEKIVDTLSESSEVSSVESAFSKLEKLKDFEIRSVNLPNASLAQRHGDADRGPIATYMTLPTQSPTSEEDPDLAIVVLHEDNLSEHQKQVISRFRTGMKRRRSHLSSEIEDHLSDNLTVQDQTEPPIIIPISDRNANRGSATGFAVIANSEPQTPLSVDIDIKSWLRHKHLEGKEPPIFVTGSLSKRPLRSSRDSSLESRISREKVQQESDSVDSNTTKPPHWNIGGPSKGGRHQDLKTLPNRSAETSRYTSKRNETLTHNASGERPKSAPSRNDGTKPFGKNMDQRQESTDKKLELKNKAQEVAETSRKSLHKSLENLQKSPQILEDKSRRKESSPQKSSVDGSRPLKSPPPKKPVGKENDRYPSSNNESDAMNKPDNTVKVLFEPKSRSTWKPKEKPRKSEYFDDALVSNNTPKPNKTNEKQSTSPIRTKNANDASKKRSEKSPVIEKPKPPRPKSQEPTKPKLSERPMQKNQERSSSKSSERPTTYKTPERPRTAPPGTEQNRLRGFRGHNITKEPTKPQENRDQKRSLSMSAPPTPTHPNDLRRTASNTSNGSRSNSGINNSRTTIAPDDRSKTPQTSTATTERITETESHPVNESCDSSISIDSGGVPLYRLKRNISYLSEYRNTIDSLRAKCVMKDHMIDTLLDEVQSLSPTEETYNRLLLKLSNCKFNGPPPRRDYTCSELGDLFPKIQKEAESDNDRSTSPDEDVMQCVCPNDFRVAGKVGCDCLLLTWKSTTQNDAVAGYEVDVDGQLTQRVRSPTRTSALLMDLDLSRAMRFTLRTLRKPGLQACHHPPLEILFAPSGDDWVLDDLALPAAAAKAP